MSDDDEMAELARRYVELWQDQMRAVATDPETARAMAVLTRLWMPWMTGGVMGGMTGGMAGAPGSAATSPSQSSPPEPAGEAEGQREHDRSNTASSDPAASDATGRTAGVGARPSVGTEAAGAASGDRDVDLGELARRLDTLERRIADLDTALRGSGPRPRRRPDGNRRPGQAKSGRS